MLISHIIALVLLNLSVFLCSRQTVSKGAATLILVKKKHAVGKKKFHCQCSNILYEELTQKSLQNQAAFYWSKLQTWILCEIRGGNIYESLWPIRICCKICVGKYFRILCDHLESIAKSVWGNIFEFACHESVAKLCGFLSNDCILAAKIRQTTGNMTA